MARHKSRRSSATLAGIDITPLVDLTFILLIVFMVTAPAMQSHIQIPLFDGQGKVDKKAAVIELDHEGRIEYDGLKYSPDELKALLPQVMRDKNKFAISADENRAYGEVIALMRLLKEAGIENVDLVTKLK
jgi:biopolymer transport protein TolR